LALFSQVPQEELEYYKESITYEIRGYQELIENYQIAEPDLALVSEANKAFKKAVRPYQQD
jgi:L-lysine 2,3-aminomutase